VPRRLLRQGRIPLLTTFKSPWQGDSQQAVVWLPDRLASDRLLLCDKTLAPTGSAADHPLAVVSGMDPTLQENPPGQECVGSDDRSPCGFSLPLPLQDRVHGGNALSPSRRNQSYPTIPI
jgi:hypothetical protein